MNDEEREKLLIEISKIFDNAYHYAESEYKLPGYGIAHYSANRPPEKRWSEPFTKEEILRQIEDLINNYEEN